jgi:hypothetical protein
MAKMKAEVNSYIRSVLKKTEEAFKSKSTWFEFKQKSTDGRLNSIDNEHEVTEFLLSEPSLAGIYVKKASKAKSKKKANADEEDNRAFGDIGIDLSQFGIKEPFPCNIKIISEDNKSGNNSCGLTTLISYTYQIKCSNHTSVVNALIQIDSEGYEKYDPQLYGLIILKKEKQECWVGTFDEVPWAQISTNPSNPLQVSFPRTHVDRTKEEYMHLLFNKVKEYYYKKSEPALLLREHERMKEERSTPACDRS